MTVSCHFIESLGLVGLVHSLFLICVCVCAYQRSHTVARFLFLMWVFRSCFEMRGVSWSAFFYATKCNAFTATFSEINRVSSDFND